MSTQPARGPARTPNDALIDAALIWLAQHYPTCIPETLTLTISNPLSGKQHLVQFPIFAGFTPAKRILPMTGSPACEEKATRPVEEIILETVGDDPMSMRDIAKKSGYKYSGHLRDAIRKLAREGKLERTLDGFKKASLPV